MAGGWSRPRPDSYTPIKFIVQVGWWAPGPVCTCAGNLAHPSGSIPRTDKTVVSRYTVSPVRPIGTMYGRKTLNRQRCE